MGRGSSENPQIQEATMKKLKYRRLILVASVLSDQWNKILPAGDRRIGVLLPNVNATPVTLLSLWFANKVPAILNYSSGPAIMLACARLAGIRQIITSRNFLEHAKLDLHLFKEAGIDFLFLEEVRAGISGAQKLAQFLRLRFNLQPLAFSLQPSAFPFSPPPPNPYPACNTKSVRNYCKSRSLSQPGKSPGAAAAISYGNRRTPRAVRRR